MNQIAIRVKFEEIQVANGSRISTFEIPKNWNNQDNHVMMNPEGNERNFIFSRPNITLMHKEYQMLRGSSFLLYRQRNDW
jgi:hypothetical protein